MLNSLRHKTAKIFAVLSRRSILLPLLALFVIACSLANPLTPTPTATLISLTATVASTQTARILPSVRSPLEEVPNYRLRIERTWTSEGAASPSERIVWLHEATDSPPAQRLVISSVDSDASWLQLGDLTWECTDGETACNPSTITSTHRVSQIFTQPLLEGVEPLLVMANPADFNWIGVESVAGLPADHYQISFPPLAETIHPGEVQSLTSSDAQIWISQGPKFPGLVMRMLLSWDGQRQDIPGTGLLSYELFD